MAKTRLPMLHPGQWERLTARQKMSRGADHLMAREPFFGHLFHSLRMIEDTDGKLLPIPSMGVDGVSLAYNPKFVNGLSEEHILGVLAHETLHVALLHPVRRGERDPAMWNVACLAEGTLIRMADGSEKPIEAVQIGDYTWSPFGPNEVLGTVNSGTKPVFTMQGSRRRLTLTGDHKVLTAKGFVSAEAIDTGLHVYIQGEAGGCDVRGGELHNDVDQGPVPCDRDRVRLYGAAPSQQGIVRGSLRHQALEHQGVCVADSGRTGISGWDDRRGRYDITGGNTRAVLQTVDQDHQHKHALVGVAGSQGDVGCEADKRLGRSVLHHGSVRLGTGELANVVTALLGGQGPAGEAFVGAYLAEKELFLSLWSTDARLGNLIRDQGLASEHVSLKDRGGEAVVYDLVTRQGVVFAEGFAVHNCDMVVNHMLNKRGYALPPGGIPHGQVRDHETVEEVYDRLEKSGAMAELPEWGTVSDPGGLGEKEGKAPGKDQADQQGEMAVAKAVAGAAQKAREAGDMPGDLEAILRNAFYGKRDWKDSLKRFLGGGEEKQPDWSRPNRRYIAEGDYFPGAAKFGPGEVAVVADTSGSVDDTLLAKFVAEMRKVNEDLQPEAIHALACDCRVQFAQTYSPHDDIIIKPLGRGGTAFSPAFQWVRENAPKTRALVYFTDLEVSDFGPDPGYPVLFVVWPGGSNRQPPFGEVIYM